VNFGLGETADMLRETVREFAAREIAPRAETIDRDNVFPRDLWPKLGELGLFGVTVDENHGGAGMGYVEQVIAVEEISRASASVGLSYGVHANLVVNHIARFAPKRRSANIFPADVGRMGRRARHERARRGLRRALDALPRGASRTTAFSSTAQDVDHQRTGRRSLIVYAKTGDPAERRTSPPS
jgi:alkylation response protein AidB-like acyl-CoA dehydrogenase